MLQGCSVCVATLEIPVIGQQYPLHLAALQDTRPTSDQDSFRMLSGSCHDRYPGHAIPASAFTNAEREMGKGSDVFEWGTAAFSKIACARPAYLQVSSCF